MIGGCGGLEVPVQATFMEHNHMMEALAANGSDHALDVHDPAGCFADSNVAQAGERTLNPKRFALPARVS